VIYHDDYCFKPPESHRDKIFDEKEQAKSWLRMLQDKENR
jgi:hypothetical protein